MANEKGDEVMSVKQVSVYLQLAPSTIYKFTKEGKLPCRKVGGTWRFSRSTLDAWLCKRPLSTHSQSISDSKATN